MHDNTRTTAVGVFDNRTEAQQAVQELKRLGFRDEQIGVVSRNAETGEREHTTGSGSHVEEGAIAGAATGVGVGALWGLGIAAGLLPAIGPVIAGGTLAAIIASAATGAAAAGLAGALIGMGIPEEEAAYYEGEFKSGRTLVTVKADDRGDEARAVLRRFNGRDRSERHADSGTSRAATATGAAQTASRTTANQSVAGAPHQATTARTGAETVQLREEQLNVSKQDVETGAVKVRKEVHTEHKSIDVPVTREEIVIERTAVHGQHGATGDDIRPGQEIRIPVREEQVKVEKEMVVKEEVKVGKRKVQDTEHVSADLHKEDVRVETTGDVNVRDQRRND